jgi:polyphosphate kinase 2
MGKDKGSKDGKASKKGADRLGKSDYADALAPLEVELNRLARWVAHEGKRVLVICEGRDTAGKGGAISAVSDCLNPRQCRVVALPKPSEVERTQWYFQRYTAHLPAAGEIVLFDRSWYNRAGVEKVMGYCSEDEVQRFLKQAPVFEQQLVDDGILLFKYWLTVDQAAQEERFAERRSDPLKRWKLSPIDLKARLKYREYGEAPRHEARAVDAGGLQRPAARPADADPAPAGPAAGLRRGGCAHRVRTFAWPGGARILRRPAAADPVPLSESRP